MFRLILVEDEPRILRNLKEKINSLRSDFKIVGTYDNGEDALSELDWTQPHAIISDIRMPIMDGITFISHALNRIKDVQCAFLSGYDDFSYLRQAIQLGVSDYLLKPTNEIELVNLLDKMKSNLLLKHHVVINEILHQLSIQRNFEADQWQATIVNENFYHGYYLVLCGWSPHKAIASELTAFVQEMAAEEGQVFQLPNLSSNEHVVIIGFLHWSEEKKEQWEQALKQYFSTPEFNSLSVSGEVSLSGFRNISEIIYRLREQVKAATGFQFTFSWLDQERKASVISTSNVKQLITRLAQLITKQQRQHFSKELEHYWKGDNYSNVPLTRKELELVIIHIAHELLLLQKDQFEDTLAVKMSVEQEIIDGVWSEASLDSIIGHVIDIFTSYFFATETEQLNNRDWAKEAHSYITNHFREYIALTTVAEQLDLNPSYLNRIFKRNYNLSIPDFILKLRIEEACTFIKSFPYALIKEVAEHVGFTDPYYFSKVFKTYTGYTPSEYKNKEITSL